MFIRSTSPRISPNRCWLLPFLSSAKSFAVVCRVGCGLAVLKIFEGKGILKNNFVRTGASSFANFGLCVARVVCKCACPCVNYFTIITKVPAIIKPAPIVVFNVNVSPKKIVAKMIVKATLSLSMVATCDTLPNCNALK